MRVAICDDEIYQRETLKRFIKPYVQEYRIEIFEFDSGERLAQSYDQNNTYDIILLDIRMKDMDGVQTAEHIRKYDKRAIVIFISSFVQYITSALRYNVFQFLIKPVKQDLFDDEFSRALSTFLSIHSRYVIKIRDRLINLEINDIIYIETYQRHLLMHTRSENLTYNGTLKEEFQKLAPYDFVMIHQAYIVNMAEIKTIEKNVVILKNSEIIPMSKHLRKAVLSKFNLYMGRRCL